MATTFAPNCSNLVNNAAGAVQTLPDVRVGGKVRTFTEVVSFSGQAIGDQIMVARIPYGSVPLGIILDATASFGSASTIALGDKNNVSRFANAGTFTSTDTPTRKMNAAACGIPLTTCYDYAGVSSTAYEDILLTIGVSSLPSTGSCVVTTEYIDYSS